MSYNWSYDEYDYKFIQGKMKQSEVPLPPTMISRAITKETKVNGNFKNGEELFQYLVQGLKQKVDSKPDYWFSELDIIAMQRALSCLVRYAPNTDKARYYFCMALNDLEAPLRTSTFELTLLNNLLYIYSSKNDDKLMKDALELIKVALDIGVFHFEIPRTFSQQNSRFNDPCDVFHTLASKVLRYFRMEFNENKTAVIPTTRQFSH